jgi:hypothetical protein
VLWGIVFKHCYVEFDSKAHYNRGLANHTVDHGVELVQEWYDRDGRFYQPPHANPFPVFNPNGMDVDHVEGQRIEEREPPLHPEEVEEEFDAYQPYSQAW